MDDDIRWTPALLNGLFVWLISLAGYMLPAVVSALWIGARLGPQGQDPLAIGQQINQEVYDIYATNWLLIAGLVVITAVLILWRARVVAKGTWHMRWINGLLVGVVPALLSLLMGLCGGFGTIDVVASAIYLAVGVVGGILAPH